MKQINIDNQSDINVIEEHINYLAQFMSKERIEVLRKVLEERTDYITMCLENIYHGHNASAVLRTCEAFGIQKVHVIEDLLPFEPTVGIVRGTDKWLDIENYKEDGATEQVITKLKSEGYRIVATSPHADGKTPDNFDITKGKVALFIGTEKYGLSKTAMDMADEYITIPMCGFVESLNLSVCSAIVLNAFRDKLTKVDKKIWALSDEDKNRLIYKWTRLSVRNADQILLKYEREK